MIIKKHKIIIIFTAIIFVFIFTVLYVKKITADKNVFNWQLEKGTTIKVYLNQHPYSEAIIKSIPEFERRTGIAVEYYISPETIFQNKLFYYLEYTPSKIDVTMMGVHYLWKSAQEGLIENLDDYVTNSRITHSDYDFSDFNPKVLDTLKWNTSNNADMENSSLWAIPLGFELSAITYNKNIFSNLNLSPPENLDELEHVTNVLNTYTNMVPIGIRGINRWNSLLFGYLTLFYNYGLTDFKKVDNKLVPQFNSEKSIEFHKKWVNIVRKSISKDWNQNSWYKLSAEIGAGKVAMVFDSDLIGYSQNISNVAKEKGNLSIAPIPEFKNEDAHSGIWSWGLSINKNSTKKTASWLFIQYFTSKEFLTMATENYDYLSPPRNSILNSEQFSHKVSKDFRQHLLDELENSKILLTPQPYAIELMKIWTDTLHKMYNYQFDSIEEGLEYLNKEAEKIIDFDNSN